ncbi:unnamed protein product [Rotaria magnacalcarata]|uniref:Uncharacterized protein n=1 Tax=Rotaria magnacalcarata TaxID=392030 RepID=A0A815JT44_9BILA|nr:unnamed protein product [Rotaria magnacalcarata]CAF1553290.1 unnamed protein product [Rotaria magnacalcarata]
MDASIVKYCNACQELAGFYCNGCNRIFCQQHAYEHRQSFYEQLDWLTVDHDDFVCTLNDDASIAERNYLSKQIIDKWEEESIGNIRKIAAEARLALIDAIEHRIDGVKEKLKALTEKLQAVSHNNSNHNHSFDERNIKQWATDLHNLKHDFFTRPTFTVRVHGSKPVVMPIIRIQPDSLHENHSNSPESQNHEGSFGLVPLKDSTDLHEPSSRRTSTANQQHKTSNSLLPADHQNVNLIIKTDDRFSICSDHVKILEYGQLFTHDSSTRDASIGGYHDYSQGEHKIFFHIEHMTSNQWIFFGIISKHVLLGQKAFMDSSAYGWAGYNKVYMGGKPMPILNGYHGDMKVNDFVELTIDCERQTLCLWHSRQMCKNKLPIDIRTCPFPWQFLISCHNSNDSVRVLPSSMSSIIKREQDKLDHAIKIREIQLKHEQNCFPIPWEMNTAETVR